MVLVLCGSENIQSQVYINNNTNKNTFFTIDLLLIAHSFAIVFFMTSILSFYVIRYEFKGTSYF